MIELPILWMNETACQLSDLGLKVERDYDITIPVTFYNINAISPYHENGHIFTIIHSNNDEFISTYDYETVKEMVKEAMYGKA